MAMWQLEAELDRKRRETYEYLQRNPDTGQLEMMTDAFNEKNRYRQKARAKDVIKEIEEKIAKYRSWGGDYMVGKVKLLNDDLIAWQDYHDRLYTAPSDVWVWFDPDLPRHIYFWV